MVLCILIYFHTRIQTFIWTVIETVFLYFIFFIDLWTVTYFFFKYVHDSRKSFLELQQSNNLKKIISDILKAFTCMNKNITSTCIIHVWNDKRTGHIYVPIPYLTHPPPLKKKNLSYPIQMKPTNIKQYCQPIFIRDDSISIKWCVTDFFFFFFVFFSLSTLVLFKHPYSKDCFAARNIYDYKALAILANNSCTRIKVVVQ